MLFPPTGEHEMLRISVPYFRTTYRISGISIWNYQNILLVYVLHIYMYIYIFLELTRGITG